VRRQHWGCGAGGRQHFIYLFYLGIFFFWGETLGLGWAPPKPQVSFTPIYMGSSSSF